jgi:hypothetical protein
MHVAIAHGVRYAIDPVSEKLCATAQKPAHVVDFFPVPLGMIVFSELPHAVDNASSEAPDQSGSWCHSGSAE